MQAIQTKFIPRTNRRESRVKAWCECSSLTLGWDHALDVEENHEKVAKALQEKLGWVGTCYGKLVGGTIPSGGYAFVFVQERA